MFLGIGDVHVNIKKASSLGYDYYQVDGPLKPIDMYNIKWVLEVSALDVDVEVYAQAHPNCPQEIALSCLLAALKNVTDSHIYEAACARIESQMGFAVDRWISPKIAKVDKQESYGDGVFFQLSVIPKLFETLIAEPVFTAHIHDNAPDEIEITMDVECGQKLRSSLFFSREIWEYNSAECIRLAKFKLVNSLYEEKPELSHLWTQIRYNLFDMKYMSAETISWYNSVQGSPTPWAPMGYASVENVEKAVIKSTFKPGGHINPAAMIPHMPPAHASEEDRRVQQLPALNKMVKNPVTGKTATLRNVIISLNDASRWTREQIADWLETLDIDISFKVKTNDEQD